MKKTFIALLLTTSAFFATATVEKYTLSSGEVFTGEAIGEKDGKLSLKTKYGTLTIPATEIAKKEVVKTSDAVEAKVAETPAPAPTPKEDPAAPNPKEKEPEWVADYRNFVETYFPEGWQFRLKGGIEYAKTDSSTLSYAVSFDVKKEWDINIFTATFYYNYATQKSSAGVEEKTIDDYGFDTAFKRFFNDTKTWYFANIFTYEHDQVASIRHEVEEAITVGYRFDFKRHNLTIDVGPGPAVRYTQLMNDHEEWTALAVMQEDLNWIISKTFKFEQSFYATLDLQDTSKYGVTFKMALVAHLTKVMDLALRYSYKYDNISSDTVTEEQRLILAFEFPFNWK